MKQLMVLLLAIFAAASPTLARLGDSGDRIEDSYGPILQRRLRDDGTVTVVYRKDRYLCFVTFADGRSISESYSHLKNTDLSEREIARFLKANSAGATWMPEGAGSGRRFTRSDGKAEAIYGDLNGRPTLSVREVRAKRRH